MFKECKHNGKYWRLGTDCSFWSSSLFLVYNVYLGTSSNIFWVIFMFANALHLKENSAVIWRRSKGNDLVWRQVGAVDMPNSWGWIFWCSPWKCGSSMNICTYIYGKSNEIKWPVFYFQLASMKVQGAIVFTLTSVWGSHLSFMTVWLARLYQRSYPVGGGVFQNECFVWVESIWILDILVCWPLINVNVCVYVWCVWSDRNFGREGEKNGKLSSKGSLKTLRTVWRTKKNIHISKVSAFLLL